MKERQSERVVNCNSENFDLSDNSFDQNLFHSDEESVSSVDTDETMDIGDDSSSLGELLNAYTYILLIN